MAAHGVVHVTAQDPREAADRHREREHAGDGPWTTGAFDEFLHRFRKGLREALRAD